MRFWRESNDYVNGECEACKMVLKVKLSGASKIAEGFSLNPAIRCPKCTSTQLTRVTKDLD